jgi:predicted RNA-binding Zn ribbon-like protein
MNFTRYTEAPVNFAAALVNTSLRMEGVDVESLKSVGDLREFLEANEPLVEPEWDLSLLEQSDLYEFLRLRSRLEAVFDASDDTVAAEVINSLLAESRALPQVSDHDRHPWHLHYTKPGASAARTAAAACGMALAIVLCEGGFARFGTCSNKTCADVFIDTTKNASRKYCSDVCANRAAVAAHRARARAKQAGPEERAGAP